jgi:hypothetical protein
MRTIRLLALLAVSSLFALISAAQQITQTGLNQDPEKAVITAKDVGLFWSAYDLWLNRDHGAADKLAAVLQREYLDKGSDGVKGFIPHRILSADHLAQSILGNRSYYESVRANTEKMEAFIPDIRKNFRAFKEMYPEARFPAVYFVIGAQSSGGTSTDAGLIIGSEMFGNGPEYLVQLSDVVPMVIHELIHFQQKGTGEDLLSAALLEGGADFVAELVVGRHIDESNKSFGDSHEEELWRQFEHDIQSGGKIGDWMYVYKPKNGKPRDLGYYMGYKICQSYYEISTDKREALKTITEMRSPKEILAGSGYDKRFH